MFGIFFKSKRREEVQTRRTKCETRKEGKICGIFKERKKKNIKRKKERKESEDRKKERKKQTNKEEIKRKKIERKEK